MRAKELLARVKLRLEKLKKLRDSLIEPQLRIEEKSRASKLYENSNILLTIKSNTKFVKLNSIICLAAEGEYSKVFLQSGERPLIRKLLKQWEKYLPDNIFKRIHRSTIIITNYVGKIVKWSKRSYIVHLQFLKQKFIISERYAVKMKKEMLF